MMASWGTCWWGAPSGWLGCSPLRVDGGVHMGCHSCSSGVEAWLVPAVGGGRGLSFGVLGDNFFLGG